ncbi:PAS domain-containing protein [Halomicrobium salinisoli]|uniref:PAS domain-containing protein n=1 Tax=Halomicrobium salinisoli TaxID=2878391 RepID=UPI001CF046A1|nr:PAS domain-containing protein [Halomicrobium salinisoli]
MEPSDSAPAGRDDVRHLFSRLEEPGTPYTTTEVADRLGCSPAAAERTLSALADRGELRSRETDGGSRVWWQPVGDADATDGRSRLREFGAFVSAVRDYAIFMLDPDGTVASWNQGARRIKGYDEDEIVGRHFSAFYTEEDRAEDVPEANLEKAAEQGRAEDEGWRVRADGSRFWANVVITAIRDVDGALQGFTKVTRDMTEQREYELQLRKERDLTEQILETVPVGICVIDADGTVLRANQRALDRIDVDAAGLTERSIDDWDLYDGEGEPVPAEERPWSRVAETGRPVYDFQCRSAPASDGQWFSLNAAPLDGDTSGDADVVVAIEDITDQKERERRLEQRKAELETELSGILGRISDAFFALDEEWRFTHLNEHAAELFRRTEADLTGQSFWAVFPERSDGRLWEEFRAAMDAQEPTSFELYDGELDAWLEYNVYPSDTGLSVYVHDITERKEYQHRLEESNERLEQFAYAASHDLQEPLRMVSSYLQLIERRYADELGDDGQEFIEFAVDGAERMRDMIDGLLAYSRVETRGEPFEPVDLDDVVADVRDDLQMRIAESDAEVTAADLPRVEGDRDQLRQVFQNLLDNAIEYSGDEPPRVHVDAERAGEEWAVSVRDEGIGIDPDDAERVFEVFQRLHTHDEYDGTGIGLALCERIVERHGGEIRVDSEPGEGSTFSVTLPAVDE